jgi:hypothetical protein
MRSALREGEQPAHALVGVDLVDEPDVVAREVELLRESSLNDVERHARRIVSQT